MRKLVLALALTACAANPSPAQTRASTDSQARSTPPNPDTTEPLVCNETEPCRALADEIAIQCKTQNLKVERGTCGALTVLMLSTDPQSVTFTSEKRYYDANGKLVATQLFVNEYGRTMTYGTLTPCPIQGPTPACPPT
jgi:hypothetical protein